MTTARCYQRRVCHARGATANVRASVRAFDQLIADVYDLAVFLGNTSCEQVYLLSSIFLGQRRFLFPSAVSRKADDFVECALRTQ